MVGGIRGTAPFNAVAGSGVVPPSGEATIQDAVMRTEVGAQGDVNQTEAGPFSMPEAGDMEAVEVPNIQYVGGRGKSSGGGGSGTI